MSKANTVNQVLTAEANTQEVTFTQNLAGIQALRKQDKA